MPVYNFCVAVDDATMGITHVLRAEVGLYTCVCGVCVCVWNTNSFCYVDIARKQNELGGCTS
jgi:hypothetical protein